MSKIHLGVASVFMVWALVLEKTALADPVYNLTALSSPQDPINLTTGLWPGINNEGQIVGYIAPGPNWHQGYGFVYNGAPGGDGSVTPLGGSTAPVNYPAIRNTEPISISDSGQILGITNPGLPGGYYLYANGQETVLPMAPAGFNNAGQVMALNFTVAPNGTVSPVVYNLSTGTQQNLPAAPGASQTWAVAINGSGQVAGNTFYPNPANPASLSQVQGAGFLYINGTMTNIGTLGGASATVVGINASGQVIGTSALSSNLIGHAFLYSNGKMTDLGSLPGYQQSSASGINAQGQVVGSVGNGSNLQAGFLYSNGVMTNLNSLINPNSGWTILSGLSINNLGQIVALGYNPSMVSVDGSGQGYVLLTPSDLAAPGNPVYPTIVPEPSSLAVYGLMAAGLALRLRRKRPSWPKTSAPRHTSHTPA